MPVSVEIPQGERWQDKITSFNEAFNKIYDTKEFSDALIKVKDRKFKVHRAVLAARSPRFEELFMNSDSGVLELDDVTEDGLENLLKFMYTDQIDNLDFNQLLQTYRAAISYQQEALKEKCDALLSEYEITIDNVCGVLNEASDIPAVNKHCVDFLQNNITAVLQSDNFLKGTTETVKNIFHFGLFENVPPMVVVENVLRWAQEQLPSDKKNLVRQQLLETKIMGNLPFHKLTSDQLVTVTETCEELFTPKELNMLFVYTAKPNSGKPLPEW